MPSPVGHSLMGYIIYRTTATAVVVQRMQLIVFYLLVANAADLDFIPGLLVGMPNRYHHGISHSVGFAALIAVACSLLMFFLKIFIQDHAIGKLIYGLGLRSSEQRASKQQLAEEFFHRVT